MNDFRQRIRVLVSSEIQELYPLLFGRIMKHVTCKALARACLRATTNDSGGKGAKAKGLPNEGGCGGFPDDIERCR